MEEVADEETVVAESAKVRSLADTHEWFCHTILSTGSLGSARWQIDANSTTDRRVVPLEARP